MDEDRWDEYREAHEDQAAEDAWWEAEAEALAEALAE